MKRATPIKQRRTAFTLVEILVTISIIVLLIGVLLPAISSVQNNARIAHVVTDISSLEASLATFKANFGQYPPSRITLHRNATGWNGDNRSRAMIRRFWPQFDFSTDGAGGTFPFPAGQDFVTLDGPECLTFFLGGVRDTDGAYIGFSKNPAQPFSLTGSSRTGPFIDFNLSRIGDSDGDGLPEYRDPIPGQSQPYIYLSSYDGRGYKAADLDQDGDLSTTNDKWMETAYMQGSSSFWKQKEFQIISPGFDGQHGPGGPYDPEKTDSYDPRRDSVDFRLIEMRESERDNITNFSGGELAD